MFSFIGLIRIEILWICSTVVLVTVNEKEKYISWILKLENWEWGDRPTRMRWAG